MDEHLSSSFGDIDIIHYMEVRCDIADSRDGYPTRSLKQFALGGGVVADRGHQGFPS